MFNENQIAAPKKTLAVTALAMSFLSIGLLIAGRLINMSDDAAGYSYEGEAIRRTSSIILAIFAVVSVAGFAVSLVALAKSVRNPAIYGGKGIAVISLILNGIFSLISIGIILLLLSLAAHYLSGK